MDLDDALPHLTRFPKLKEVLLYGISVHDGLFDKLAGLEDLEQLRRPSIRRSPMPGPAARRAPCISALVVAERPANHRSDARGAPAVETPDGVEMPATGISDEGLKANSDHGDLERLSVGNTNVTDAGVEHLAALSELTTLQLHWRKITDASLKTVAGLQRLMMLES